MKNTDSQTSSSKLPGNKKGAHSANDAGESDFKGPGKMLGRYRIIRTIGVGGMGEVLLAWDTVCHRQIALKRIRTDLIKHPSIRKRFLNEAYLTARLNHPAIIPILSIHDEEDEVYYTMPFVAGSTLKELLRKTRRAEKLGDRLMPEKGSITALIRIFVSVATAIQHAHEEGLLHRDIKPENVVIGQNGEVILLDWGLIEKIGKTTSFWQYGESAPSPSNLPSDNDNLTIAGKVVGTVAYMAPERTYGATCSIQTEVYALGVMLYQLLSLQMPFSRGKFSEFKKSVDSEVYLPPEEAAPYRDIPLQLSQIVEKAMSVDISQRYQTVREMVVDLEKFIEGKPLWNICSTLKIERDEDWELHENIALAKHLAISKSEEATEWVSLLISKQSFPGNIRLESTVQINPEGQGIGFLLSIPEPSERKGLEQGFLIWIDSSQGGRCQIFSDNIAVLDVDQIGLRNGQHHKISIEKGKKSLRVYVDGKYVCHYISYRPFTGTHVGHIYRDTDFELDGLSVMVGSQNATVSCLAVPDTFFAEKEYEKAIAEYQRIGDSFPGLEVGREALFQVGITYIDHAFNSSNEEEKHQLLQTALIKFEKLRDGAGAPLEYLGKSLVYQAMGNVLEEVKCLELSLRKWKRHPLIRWTIRQTIFRFHEASHVDRCAAFHFALLSLFVIPEIFQKEKNAQLLEKLKSHTPPLAFFEPISRFGEKNATHIDLAAQFAFWLKKPMKLVEIIKKTPRSKPEWAVIRQNCFFGLIQLGEFEIAEKTLHFFEYYSDVYAENRFLIDQRKLSGAEKISLFFKQFGKKLYFRQVRILEYLFNEGVEKGYLESLMPFLKQIDHSHLMPPERARIAQLIVSAALHEGHLESAEKWVSLLPKEHYLNLCYEALRASSTPNPIMPTTHFSAEYQPIETLVNAAFSGRVNLAQWEQTAFEWEKIMLYKQLALLFCCLNDYEQSKLYKNKLNEII